MLDTTGKPSIVPKVRDDIAKIGTARPTFTRTGTATRVNSSGYIETVTADVPRFDYDPVTLALRGLLIEEARTNLIKYSQAIGGEGSPTVWATTDVTLVPNIPDNETESPANDHTTTGVFVDANNGEVRQVVNGLTSGATYAFSIFLLGSSVTEVRVRAPTSGAHADVNLSTGAVTLSSDGSPQAGVAAYAEAYTAGGRNWYRVTLVYRQVGTSESLTIRENGSGTIGTFYAWGAQLELTTTATVPFHSSYIPTTSASVARGADICTVTLGDWFDEDEGTMLVSWRLGRDTMSATLYNLNDGTSDNLIRSRYAAGGTSNGNAVLVGGATQASIADTNQLTTGTTYREAFAFEAAGFARSVDGGAVSSGPAGSIPEVTTLKIGSNQSSAEQPNCHFRELAYYDERLADADLVTISGGGSISTEPAVLFDFTTEDLEEQTGSLDNARIGYHNRFRDATIVASSAATDYPADAAQRPETFEAWQPTSLQATWRADLGSAQPVDYVGIAAHNLGTKECSLKVQYSVDTVTWYDASDTFTPDNDDDAEILLLFSPQIARYWRLVVSGVGSPTEAPTIGVIYGGEILTMQRSIYGGHAPIDLQRETVLHSSLSEGGEFLGQGIQRVGFVGQAAFRYLTPGWVRENFKPFKDDARQYPFFFAWKPNDYPESVAYCWSGDDIRPSNMGTREFMQVGWSMAGYDSE